MPLYYFDARNGDEVSPDEEGTELDTMDDMQDEAAYALSDMLRDIVRVPNGNPLASSHDRSSRWGWSTVGR